MRWLLDLPLRPYGAPAASGSHRTGLSYVSSTYYSSRALQRKMLLKLLQCVSEPILRGKGTLKLHDDPTHMYRFDVVGTRVTLARDDPWRTEDSGSEAVFITSDQPSALQAWTEGLRHCEHP